MRVITTYIFSSDMLSMTFTATNALLLEVKFNVSSKGKEWSHIGDALYANKDIDVTEVQHQFLRELAEEHCIPFAEIPFTE